MISTAAERALKLSSQVNESSRASMSTEAHFEIEPDLYPIYPCSSQIAALLSPDFGLSPSQKSTLIYHCLNRAVIFADLSVLQFLLHDNQALSFIDLNLEDEDGLVLVSVIILGFGSDSEREVEREECIRLLVGEGADVSIPDKAGWTPLHHAALVAPPTVIAYLLTHGCSALSVTLRNLTPHDIVTAHSVIPGREDVALFLEEAMRGEGWEGGRVVRRRLSNDRRLKACDHQKIVREGIGKTFELDMDWWNNGHSEPSSSEVSDEEDKEVIIFTPPVDYTSMLVFSPTSLPQIMSALITNFTPATRNSEPASVLYMLARFACLTCDHNWLEDLIISATDAIEDTVFGHPDDLAYLIFWLYNMTIWLHLMRCDVALSETCDLLGSFFLIEEVVNSVFVFLIRFAERQLDKNLDSALLEYSPLSSDFDAIQFESEWYLFRTSFLYKKKSGNPSSSASSFTGPPSPGPAFRPTSPSSQSTQNTSKGFSSLRQGFIVSPSVPSMRGVFNLNHSDVRSPNDIEAFLTAMHLLLVDSGINPVFLTQLWSQVMYWTSCELFNRILTRKRYLCRSNAVQISMNLSVLEEWVNIMGLPPGVQTHFAPVRELLQWLQCLSTMNDFSDLVGTIQSLKHLNPLQMRRAVRDYRYEVNETRMSDDCSQYLEQLQKDWERQRVKLGVKVLRKEIDREKTLDDSLSSGTNEIQDEAFSFLKSASLVGNTGPQKSIDLLFDRFYDIANWMPAQPPEILGELLDSRYMLPLLLPSDHRMLSASPGPVPIKERRNGSPVIEVEHWSNSRTGTKNGGVMSWRSESKRIRRLGTGLLRYVNGNQSCTNPQMSFESRGDFLASRKLDESSSRSNMALTPLAVMSTSYTRPSKIPHGEQYVV